MIACARFPCGGHAGGCSFADCMNNNQYAPGKLGVPFTPAPVYTAPQMGCICPPTSEKTCESRICPRKDHLRASTASSSALSEDGK